MAVYFFICGRRRVAVTRRRIICLVLLNYFVWLRITDEGSVPEVRKWSILLIKSGFKWSIHLSRSLFLYLNFSVSVIASWPECSNSPRAHVTKVDFGWFVAFWKHQNCSCLKSFEIAISWVYYTNPLASACIVTFGLSFFIFLNYFLVSFVFWSDPTKNRCLQRF